MDNRFEKIVQKQDGLIAALEKQHKMDQGLIDLQKEQIRVLQEKIDILEKEKQALTDAGNEMAAASRKLEEICLEQQELISSFSGLLSEK